MMTCRVKSEPLAIQHVGQPGDRMPVGKMKGCKCPLYVLPGQAPLHVIIEISVIVVIDKKKMPDWDVEQQSYCRYNQSQDRPVIGD